MRRVAVAAGLLPTSLRSSASYQHSHSYSKLVQVFWPTKTSQPAIVSNLTSARRAQWYSSSSAEGGEGFRERINELVDVLIKRETGVTKAASEFMALYRAGDTKQRHTVLKQLEWQRANRGPGEIEKACTNIYSQPGGVKFMVEMRTDILEFGGASPIIDGFLLAKLKDTFCVDALSFRRIEWQSTPAAQLEFLSREERVHRIRSLADLKRRLDVRRRVFAFFHPVLPDSPVVFINVALLKTLPHNVQDILRNEEHHDEREATTAVFYSISSTIRGLKGIDLGNFLIKRSVVELKQELPNITNYVTFSPIPGFARWLEKEWSDDVVREDEVEVICRRGGHEDVREAFNSILQEPTWWESAETKKSVKGPLVRACARYLLDQVKYGSRDPVANFHCKNGAIVDEVIFLGDTSNKGLAQSHGMMASYRYILSDVDSNMHNFFETGILPASKSVRSICDSKPQTAAKL